MKRIAVYPGSFDPPTNGHIDVVNRALKLFDFLIIAINENPEKETLFSTEERTSILKNLFKGLKRVKITHFNGLLVDFVKKSKADVIVRGLRAVSDFEYEFQMALMNRKLSRSIETLFLMPKEEYTYLSSSIVKEVVSFGGNTKGLVPPFIEKLLKKKLLTKGEI